MALPDLFPDSDSRLLERLRRNDRSALVALYERHRGLVLAWLRRNGGSADDASDLLQDAVIALWEKVRAGTFVESAKVSTFLLSVVKYRWYRMAVRQRREPALLPDGPDPLDSDPPADERMATDEENATLAAAIVSLGEPCRTLLTLYYWEETPTAEIARRMGFSNADTVKSRKYQCMKALERALKEKL